MDASDRASLVDEADRLYNSGHAGRAAARLAGLSFPADERSGMEYARFCMVYGSALAESGRPGEADGFFAQAEPIYAAHREYGWLASLVFNRGNVARYRGDFVAADRHYELAHDVFSGQGNKRGMAAVAGARATMALDERRLPVARELLNELVALRGGVEVGDDPEGAWSLAFLRGRLVLQLGDAPAAIGFLKQAIDIAARYLGPDWVNETKGELAPLVKRRRGKAKSWLEDLERSFRSEAGRGLATNLFSVAAGWLEQGDTGRAWALFEESLAVAGRDGDVNAGLIRDAYAASLVRSRRFERALEVAAEVSIGEIRARAARAEADMIVVREHDGALVVWHLDAHGLTAWEDAKTARLLADVRRDVARRRLLARADPVARIIGETLPADLALVLADFDDALSEPLRTALRGSRRKLVVVAPLGLLYLPWAMFAGSERETTLLPSLALWPVAKAPPTGAGLVAIATSGEHVVPPRDGDGEIWIRPDGGSAAECEAVAGLGGGAVGVSSATGFFESLSTADVLHLAVAAHEKPSFLLFDAGSGNLVPAEDIARASAACRLVVLSRFPAELGARVRGGGLVEALLRAGVRNVVLPLWPVTADPTEFVLEFHRLLREGHSPSAALARPQTGEAAWDRSAFAVVGAP